MKTMRLMITAAVLALLAQPAMAFKQTETSPQEPAAAANDSSAQMAKPGGEPGKGLNLAVPGLSLGKSNGTEVKIPGIGTVGVLPKLDFGLELLYGANGNEAKVLPDEKTETNDVQIRGTIKHRF
jgi:hypothetical protein